MNALVKIAAGIVIAKAVDAIASKAPEAKAAVKNWAERQHSKAVAAKIEVVTGGQGVVNIRVAELLNSKAKEIRNMIDAECLYFGIAGEINSLNQAVKAGKARKADGETCFTVNWETDGTLPRVLGMVFGKNELLPHEFIHEVLMTFDETVPAEAATNVRAYELVVNALVEWGMTMHKI